MADVFIACCDGLTGFPEAIEATFPNTGADLVVHLIRASMRFISHDDRKSVAAALRPIYTAATAEAAARSWTLSRAPTGARSIRPRCGCGGTPWGTVHPVFGVPAGGAEDHLHHQRQRIVERSSCARSSRIVAISPTTMRWSSCCGPGDPRHRRQTSPRTRQGSGCPKGQPRKTPPRLVEGGTVQGCNAAFGALSLAFPGRLEVTL